MFSPIPHCPGNTHKRTAQHLNEQSVILPALYSSIGETFQTCPCLGTNGGTSFYQDRFRNYLRYKFLSGQISKLVEIRVLVTWLYYIFKMRIDLRDFIRTCLLSLGIDWCRKLIFSQI